jgi:predicted transposase YbfD/YdcC
MNTFLELKTFASKVSDPRIDRTKYHNLADIIVMSLFAIIRGAQGWLDIEITIDKSIFMLNKYLVIENGVPSHDTFARVFRRIKNEELESILLDWMGYSKPLLKGKTLAMDGKTLRHSFDIPAGISALHSISIYATEDKIVLKQIFGYSKDSEIVQDVELLKLVEIQGAVVTVDAIGCQKDIVKQIIEGNEADYIIGCKDNMPSLHTLIKDIFEDADRHPERYAISYARTCNGGAHGRLEHRSCACIDVTSLNCEVFSGWTGLGTIVRITTLPDSVSGREGGEHHYISSLPCDAKDIMGRVREHWGIENSLHWILDVTLREDDCRIRKDNGPRNFAVLRRIALARIKNNMSKAGDPRVKTVRQAIRMAMLDPEYAIRLFTGGEI